MEQKLEAVSAMLAAIMVCQSWQEFTELEKAAVREAGELQDNPYLIPKKKLKGAEQNHTGVDGAINPYMIPKKNLKGAEQNHTGVDGAFNPYTIPKKLKAAEQNHTDVDGAIVLNMEMAAAGQHHTDVDGAVMENLEVEGELHGAAELDLVLQAGVLYWDPGERGELTEDKDVAIADSFQGSSEVEAQYNGPGEQSAGFQSLYDSGFEDDSEDEVEPSGNGPGAQITGSQKHKSDVARCKHFDGGDDTYKKHHEYERAGLVHRALQQQLARGQHRQELQGGQHLSQVKYTAAL